MPMTYTSLMGDKSVSGSIASWVNYTKLDTATVLDEAQSLIYMVARFRQMRTEWTFGMGIGQSEIALPDRFLDPIGRLYDATNNTSYGQNIGTDIQQSRIYETGVSGTLGNNPFTTTANSQIVQVQHPLHNLTQSSTAFYSGVPALGGLVLNGGFRITSIIDANNYYIDAGNDALLSLTGGGAAVAYTANRLISGPPSRWTIWSETVKFDTAFDRPTVFKQLYYRSPRLLSATNLTNWLTIRYPMILRRACEAAAADFMKDSEEYNKHVTAMNNLISSAAVMDDLSYRGAEFGTETP